jgi:2-dehydropantoate 2-reductase
MAASGIQVEEGAATWSAPVAVARLGTTLGPADVVLVLVKSYQTTAVAPAAAAARAGDGLLLTLQNGLGNRETLEAVAGTGLVAAGVATLGATLLGPGRVRAVPGTVVLEARPQVTDRIERLAALLRDSGLATEVEPDFPRILWRKLAANCAINALTALHGVTNGALLESAEWRDALARAAREVGALAAARGIAIGADPAELTLALARATAANRSSMLQDLARGARTEVDALNGAVVREGERLGVPTPVNRQLWQDVLKLEARA